ncbi:MAG: DUF4278 domain-containing protein [Geitlerinemataceae cyanobacterium]
MHLTYRGIAYQLPTAQSVPPTYAIPGRYRGLKIQIPQPIQTIPTPHPLKYRGTRYLSTAIGTFTTFPRANAIVMRGLSAALLLAGAFLTASIATL